MPHTFPKHWMYYTFSTKKYLNVSLASIVLSPQHDSPVIPFQLYNQPVLCFYLNIVLQLYYYDPLFAFSPYLPDIRIFLLQSVIIRHLFCHIIFSFIPFTHWKIPCNLIHDFYYIPFLYFHYLFFIILHLYFTNLSLNFIPTSLLKCIQTYFS